jgi:hypothetical protein
MVSNCLCHKFVIFFFLSKGQTYRAARRILDRVRPTRQTSRLLRRPYSPTSLSSESLGYTVSLQITIDLNRDKLMLSGR